MTADKDSPRFDLLYEASFPEPTPIVFRYQLKKGDTVLMNGIPVELSADVAVETYTNIARAVEPGREPTTPIRPIR